MRIGKEDLQGRLEGLVEEHRPPAASVALLHDGEIHEAASGVANMATGAEMTPDTIGQIASVSKLFTATLVMQLVETGRVDLDAPLKDHIPEFQVADAAATETVTPRQLLCHTCGFAGDYVDESDRGDDCLELFLGKCTGLPQLHAPGAMHSYCNSGYNIAGLLVERVTGLTYDRALQEMIVEPAGLPPLVSLPEEALVRRVAVGHLPDPDTGSPRPVPTAWSDRAGGPSGATPGTSARGLIELARIFLRGGVGPNGTRILEEETVEVMLTPQTALDPDTGVEGWGLGVMLFHWGGRRVFGHDGGFNGSLAWLRIFPDDGVAMAMLANGPRGQLIQKTIFDEVLGDVIGTTPPEPPAILDEEIANPDRFVGRYGFNGLNIEITRGAAGLEISVQPVAAPVSMRQSARSALEPVGDDRFLLRLPDRPTPSVVHFVGDGPRADGISFGLRLHRRIADGET